MDRIVLYGAPMSLYTGRARSYLIKAAIPYSEEPLVSEHYYANVLPKAGGRRSMPTIEFPDGRVIRDSVAIVDHFEAENGRPFSPTGPKQNIVSLLLDVVGAEGMLRPSMHYRWNKDADNLEFVEFHFRTLFPDRKTADERMQFLRENANPNLGIVPETVEFIESNYLALIDKLHLHFSHYPYFLGNSPCIGDFGMSAALYGHLGRDPHPLMLMQKRAFRLFRWVERMNRPEPDIGEFASHAPGLLANDEVPDSLIDVMRQLAVDFVPETKAACEVTNDYLAANADLPDGSTVERGVGMCEFDVAGVKIKAMAQPFRFYLLARVQDAYEGMDEPKKAEVDALLADCGMRDVLDYKLTRKIGRNNNLEVWL